MIEFVRISTWDAEFVAAIRRHYTGSRGAPPGKKMAWQINWCGDPLGWYGIGEPAYKLAARRALGIADARPLEFTISNFIFRIERHDGIVAPVSSAILRAATEQSERDWHDKYGWSPIHTETMVDPASVGVGHDAHVAAYCFRRAGYRSIGYTTGRTARRPPGATHGSRVWGESSPKLVLYKGPLHRVNA